MLLPSEGPTDLVVSILQWPMRITHWFVSRMRAVLAVAAPVASDKLWTSVASCIDHTVAFRPRPPPPPTDPASSPWGEAVLEPKASLTCAQPAVCFSAVEVPSRLLWDAFGRGGPRRQVVSVTGTARANDVPCPRPRAGRETSGALFSAEI